MPESLEINEALSALPHGPSFRFVDQLVRLVPGVEATAEYKVKGDEAFLKGHFPGNPMMPGVILIEALAQLGGVVAQTDPKLSPLTDLRLTAVRNAKILGAVCPGDTMTISAKIKGRLGNLIQIEGTAHSGETLLLSGSVVLSGGENN